MNGLEIAGVLSLVYLVGMFVGGVLMFVTLLPPVESAEARTARQRKEAIATMDRILARVSK